MRIFGQRSFEPAIQAGESDRMGRGGAVTVEACPKARPRPVADSLMEAPPEAPPDNPMETRLRERVLKEIDPAVAAEVPVGTLRQLIEKIIHEIATEDRIELSAREQGRIAGELANDMTGYGPLEALLTDQQVTEIMVNGPAKVYVERAGKLERTTVRFRDHAHIATIAQKIAARVGRRIDDASPMVDARLPDGSRVNVIFPPLSLDSPCISIRKFSHRGFNLDDMVNLGSLTSGVARLLEIVARCRFNVLISGGTGSGKTTLMNALSRWIDHGERIITIEDAAELQLQQPHVIRLETRPMSAEGSGLVTQRDLVWNALRMRPDRIIVGEVRGLEAFDMLQAMNTGHDGSFSTLHANSARDALTRVENMVMMGNVNLPSRAIRSQIVSALDLIVQVERMRDGVRRVTQITEVCSLEGDVVTMNDIIRFEFEQEDARGDIKGSYRSMQASPKLMQNIAFYGLEHAWNEAMREI
ncbi:MAG TPA: CpaF family protein [Rhodopila sp.]|nr:CpaF family protein [Rhodopila sp.]